MSSSGARNFKVGVSCFGFTVLELMVVVGVLASLFGLSWSAMKNYIPNEDVRQGALQLQSALLMARSEAVKTSNNAYLIAANGGLIQGWAISSSQERTYEQCVSDAQADCIYVFQQDRAVMFTGEVPQVTYDRQGRLPLGVLLNIEVCDQNQSEFVIKRTVRVASNGFPKIIEDGDCKP